MSFSASKATDIVDIPLNWDTMELESGQNRAALSRKTRKQASGTTQLRNGEMRRLLVICAVAVLVFSTEADRGHAMKAQELVQATVEYLRGETSLAEVEMTIHRPEWQRTMSIKAWTKGREKSVFWIVSPPKDKGNGTLKRGDEMWIYNPKINRVIKLPPSMMSQSWQGSDFSNNDLAKSDNIVDKYTHEIVGTQTHQGKTAYVIRSLPKPGAPVIWGMQKLVIREDRILLRQAFFDEDRKPVKILTMEKIEMMGGKLYPVRWRMINAEEREEYTLLDYRELEFGVSIPETMFSAASLQNPRF